MPMCGRSFTIASSNEEIHWSLLYFMATRHQITARFLMPR